MFVSIVVLFVLLITNYLFGVPFFTIKYLLAKDNLSQVPYKICSTSRVLLGSDKTICEVAVGEKFISEGSFDDEQGGAIFSPIGGLFCGESKADGEHVIKVGKVGVKMPNINARVQDWLLRFLESSIGYYDVFQAKSIGEGSITNDGECGGDNNFKVIIK